MQRLLLVLAAGLAGCVGSTPSLAQDVVPASVSTVKAGKPVPDLPGERFFKNVRQLTFGGENAEAYFSGDGSKLILQHRPDPSGADQIFVLDLKTGEREMVSTGNGRTTCAYFLKGDRKIIYASTHASGPEPPPVASRIGGRYVWSVHKEYDLFIADPDGGNLVRLTDAPGYDAEATICPVTGQIVFTSVRDGDLELYIADPDGSNVKRVTDRVGYDGGAFFSHDGSKLVLRSGFPKDDMDAKEYQGFLAKGVVVPSYMEITVCDRDGKNFRQVTDNGKANFAPFWHPDNKRIVFASNINGGRNFDLFLIGENGQGLTPLTTFEGFDSFPMFSPDGKHIVFASNRYGSRSTETNIFIAEWVETGDHGTTAAAKPSGKSGR